MQKCVNILTPKLLPTTLSLLHPHEAPWSFRGDTSTAEIIFHGRPHCGCSSETRISRLTLNYVPWLKMQRGANLIDVLVFSAPSVLKMQAQRRQLLISSSLATSPGF